MKKTKKQKQKQNKNRERRARKGRKGSRRKKKTDIPFNFYIFHFGDSLTLFIYIFESNLVEIYKHKRH